MQITHLGHSCLLVEAAGSRMLLDPGTFSDFAGLTQLDAVLITHQHPDHLDLAKFPALLEANPAAVVHADPQTAELLKKHEILARATAAGESFTIGDVEITPAGSQHAVIHEYLDRIGNVGLLLTAPGEPSLFHPGDALDAQPDGDVDLLAVPVNAPWGAIKETIAFIRRIRPHVVIPIHDALLNEVGRAGYLQHISGFGLDGGVDVRDLVDGQPADFSEIG
ncbi:MBL fold metallo-hydrolase [Leekyejoonella antrihumi]|uniref:MBL fold metallo-hydrolase n=1 Tax=Leekyejoonella antrihumi TaxID=1660198 RepID=A0A563DSI1_9MICO|nr:MBL fold metallo-hydrolase [Leekyejoonella antrihumi]TWP32943.1 MBL fold metallo-hydrolase [Leekyejoonella antrihumi]